MYNYTDYYTDYYTNFQHFCDDKIQEMARQIVRNSRQELIEYWHFLRDPNYSQSAQLYLCVDELRVICQINPDANTQHYVDATDIVLLDQYDGIRGARKVLFRDFCQRGLANLLVDFYHHFTF